MLISMNIIVSIIALTCFLGFLLGGRFFFSGVITGSMLFSALFSPAAFLPGPLLRAIISMS
jgi:hypothetical protein